MKQAACMVSAILDYCNRQLCGLKRNLADTTLIREFLKKQLLIIHSIAMSHPFVGGNKRTAITVAARFLFLNKHQLQARTGNLERFMIKVVKDKLEIKEIAKWLKTNSKKTK